MYGKTKRLSAPTYVCFRPSFSSIGLLKNPPIIEIFLTTSPAISLAKENKQQESQSL